MKTINIHGKKYVEVNERIKYFREHYKEWSLISEIIELTDNRCVIKSTVSNEKGIAVSTGIAYEILGSTNVNKTSFVENCETSANGRALGNLGIGIDTSIASADEVKLAIAQKEIKPKKITNIQFEAMKEAVANGDIDIVKNRMKKYIFTKNQEEEINNLLNGKIKITSVSEIIEDLGDKMREYNNI